MDNAKMGKNATFHIHVKSEHGYSPKYPEHDLNVRNNLCLRICRSLYLINHYHSQDILGIACRLLSVTKSRDYFQWVVNNFIISERLSISHH